MDVPSSHPSQSRDARDLLPSQQPRSEAEWDEGWEEESDHFLLRVRSLSRATAPSVSFASGEALEESSPPSAFFEECRAVLTSSDLPSLLSGVSSNDFALPSHSPPSFPPPPPPPLPPHLHPELMEPSDLSRILLSGLPPQSSSTIPSNASPLSISTAGAEGRAAAVALSSRCPSPSQSALVEGKDWPPSLSLAPSNTPWLTFASSAAGLHSLPPTALSALRAWPRLCAASH